MATATIARSAQAVRNRRDVQRSSISKRNASVVESAIESVGQSKRRKLNEPYVRDSGYILRKHKGKPVSLIIHLHPTHFRFDGQDGSFAYDSPMRFVIDHLRKQTVPHDMLEELWAENVPFYDGCLIVEVHNHRTSAGTEKNKRNDSANRSDTVKFSMHNYNDHVTPSPMVPYPRKAKPDKDAEKEKSDASTDVEASDNTNPSSGKDGPKVTTIVLHPTALTRHHEMLLLSSIPASEMRSKRKSGETNSASAGSAATPSQSIPPTPIGGSSSRGPAAHSRKCLEDSEWYSFQADLLVVTEPPLYLEPAKTPDEALRVLEMLSNPLHNEKPPSPKTRKRTTAEMAADDALAAEAERRMLIMDERIKPSARTGSGNNANENQSAAASLGFSRFKTLEMVRQKHEEQERIRKETEERALEEKRQADEQAQQQKLLHANRQREAQQLQQRQQMMAAQQNAQRPEQSRLLMEAQRQQQAARDHAHPQPNSAVSNPQSAQFQQQASVAQSSPIVRQQTPLTASSPMIAHGGFPMAQTSSQGPGSPPRPTSANLQNRAAAMARQASQQQQHGTPQMSQGTPNMGQAVPNRQMAQTPRMPNGSPVARLQGTPNGGMMNMPAQMGGQLGFTPEQVALLQAQRNMAQGQGHQGPSAGSPPQGMTPEQFQMVRAQQLAASKQLAMRAEAQAQQAVQNGADYNVAYNQSMMRQLQAVQMRQQMHAQMQQQQQQQRLAGQSGSPQQMHMGNAQMMQQMNHAQSQGQHPHMRVPNPMQMQAGDMTPQQMQQQQQQMAQAKAHHVQQQRAAQQQLTSLMGQYGGLTNIPPQIVSGLNPVVQSMLKMQVEKQRLQRQQQVNRANQMQQNGVDQQVPAGQPNPQYMQVLRNNQHLLLQHQQQQAQQQQQNQGQSNTGVANMNGMGMNMGMGTGNQGNFAGMPQGADLNQHFANMSRALNQNGTSQGNMGGQ